MTEFAVLDSVLAALARLPADAAADAARGDQDRRWAGGERVPAEAYLAALPAVAADPEQALVLIYGEVLARTARGESPAASEYQSRFPQWADRLALQFQIHSALGKAAPVSHDPDSTLPVEGTDPGSSRDPNVPAAIGPYRVVGELGRGGMGVVYAAWDASLNREVAVKTLRAGTGSAAEMVERFVRESHVTARLPHPGIPPVHALGRQADGMPYLAMKRVHGDTLQSLAAGRPDPARWLTAFEAVCQAVGFAHSQGVVHRDLKPANIMVGAFGEVQVMDWGLARQTPSFEGGAGNEDGDSPFPVPEAEFTQAGTVVGTPSYMAPEQARGEPTDARADVFALGGLLTFLLTGAPVFAKRSGADALKLARAGDTAASLARLDASGADAELLALARRCLGVSPADRPANGAEVAAAVAAHRAGVELRLRKAEEAKATAEARAEEQRKRQRVQLALAGTVALLLAAAGGFAWWQDRVAGKRERERAIQELETATRQRRAEDGIARAIDQATELRGKGLWSQAEDALGQGELLVPNVADAGHGARLATARRELDLLRRLDDVRLDRLRVRTGQMSVTDLHRAYAAVFASHGFDVLEGDIADLAARLRNSPIRAELVAALDDWFVFTAEIPIYERVLGVTRTAGESWRQRFRDLIRVRDLAEARAFLDSVPAGDRTASLYRFLAGLLGRQPDASIALLQDALAEHPSDFWLLYDLASCHQQRQQHPLALTALRGALALRPGTPRLLGSVGMILMEMGDLPAAERYLKESLELEPSAPTYNDLGNLKGKQSDHPAAITAYLQAIAINPKYAKAHNNLGVSYKNLRKLDDAVRAFRVAIDCDPDYVSPRLNMALILYAGNEDARGAVDALQPIFDRKLALPSPVRMKVYLTYGMALVELDRLDEAIRAFREAEKEDKRNALLQAELKKALALKASRREVPLPPRPVDNQ